jgi:hypothetical protein
MHKSSFDNCLTLEEALKSINSNTSDSFRWYPVKTSVGNILEVGGTNKVLKIDFLKLYKNNNIITTHYNDFIDFTYYIVFEKKDNHCYALTSISSPSLIKKIDTLEKLISYLENTPNLNHKEIKTKPVYRTEFSHHEIVTSNW